MTTSIRPREDFKHVSPYNTRGRKQRASELSAEESQRARKTLNAESSPLRRRTQIQGNALAVLDLSGLD